jgi:hypothetical protein
MILMETGSSSFGHSVQSVRCIKIDDVIGDEKSPAGRFAFSLLRKPANRTALIY